MKIRILSLLATVLATAVVGLAFWKFDSSKQLLFRSRARLRTAYASSVIRAKLESGISRRAGLAEGLAAYVSTHPELGQKEFESFAKASTAGDTVIRSVDLAKNNVMSHVYPFAGNEKALGFDILKDKGQRGAAERAIVTRKMVVAGPVHLVQGGTALICRMPVFLPPKKSGESEIYWGLVNILIKPDGLFQEAGLSGKLENIQYLLRGRDGRGARGGIFFGDEAILKARPVFLDVTLSGGSWQMAAVPAGGWLETAPGSWKFRTFGAFVTAIVGMLVFFFIESWFPKSGRNKVYSR